jgi:hypothetical protein
MKVNTSRLFNMIAEGSGARRRLAKNWGNVLTLLFGGGTKVQLFMSRAVPCIALTDRLLA